MNDLNLSPWLSALFDAGAVFSVSLFGVPGRLRVPPRWDMRLGPLPEHLVYFVAEGGLDAEFNGQACRVTAGDLLWAGRGAHIHYRLRDDATLVLWRFRLQAHDSSGHALEWPGGFRHFSPARDCQMWMERIVDEAADTTPFEQARLRGLLACLLTEMLRLVNTDHSASGALTRAQRAAIEEYCAEHAPHRASPADLARLIGLTPDYFARCFRRTYGVAPRRWLLEERMRRAALRLLESNLNISEIARELGYDDVFLFSRQFKNVSGCSPTVYRKRH